MLWNVRNVLDVRNDKGSREADDTLLLRERPFSDCRTFAILYARQYAGGDVQEDTYYLDASPKALYLTADGDKGYIVLCVQEVF